MFSTFSTDFSPVESKSLPLAKHNLRNKAQEIKFFGPRARSYSGCLCCRRRKKKCDETYPVCLGCQKMSLECEWPKNKSKPHDRVAKRQPKVSEKTEEVGDGERSLALVSSVDPEVPDLSEFFMTPLNNVLFGRALPHLDETAIEYLSYYSESFCSFIPIGNEHSNYFLTTFMQLAHSRESILYALCAWGGFLIEIRDQTYKQSIDYSQPWQYMQKSAKLIMKEINETLTPETNEDFFVLFSFYLIFIGIEVCTGDVCHWGTFLAQCANLIKSFGGLARVLEMFQSNNDIKWLLHNFQFHDLLSSSSLRQGTILPIEEYEACLPADCDYGLDPLQGAVGAVYNYFGEISNAQVELRQMWCEIEESLERAQMKRSLVLEDCRDRYFTRVREVYDKYSEKLANCTPSEVHLQMLSANPERLALQKKLFDLYVLICKIHLNTEITRQPPSSTPQQDLLHQSLKIVDELIGTPMIVALSLSLLICGMMCYTDYDRERMRERFQFAKGSYYVQNLMRIEEIVEDSWERCPDGTVVVDWSALAEEKGWNLYVG